MKNPKPPPPPSLGLLFPRAGELLCLGDLRRRHFVPAGRGFEPGARLIEECQTIGLGLGLAREAGIFVGDFAVFLGRRHGTLHGMRSLLTDSATIGVPAADGNAADLCHPGAPEIRDLHPDGRTTWVAHVAIECCTIPDLPSCDPRHRRSDASRSPSG